jgi:hypothetical protein
MGDPSLDSPIKGIELKRFFGNGINIRYAVARPEGTPKGMVDTHIIHIHMIMNVFIYIHAHMHVCAYMYVTHVVIRRML